MNKKVKVLAVASIGGHWIQLLRLTKAFDPQIKLIYISTNNKCKEMIPDNRFYKISDFSRWDFYKIFPVFFQAIRIIVKENPSAVISTGAAPGLICLFIAKLGGKKTIWVDSLANVDKLSLSGKIASKFVSRTYTQWEHLAENNKIRFVGSTL